MFNVNQMAASPICFCVTRINVNFIFIVDTRRNASILLSIRIYCIQCCTGVWNTCVLSFNTGHVFVSIQKSFEQDILKTHILKSLSTATTQDLFQPIMSWGMACDIKLSTLILPWKQSFPISTWCTAFLTTLYISFSCWVLIYIKKLWSTGTNLYQIIG